MSRSDLQEVLRRYRERYPLEAPVVDEIESLVSGHANCFDRSCRPGHVTASAWVLSPDGSRCLLVHHVKLGRWLQPGGHCDGQTDPGSVARREVEEETGLRDLAFLSDEPLDLDVHRIPARHNPAGLEIESAHDHHDFRYLLQARGHEVLLCSEESHDVRWFTRTELMQATDEESVLRMMHKAGPHA
ncbi:MAG: NUDIX hydrolase [Planctomycetota bacterium]